MFRQSLKGFIHGVSQAYLHIKPAAKQFKTVTVNATVSFTKEQTKSGLSPFQYTKRSLIHISVFATLVRLCTAPAAKQFKTVTVNASGS
ncbi:hypothetical protein CFF01_13675 [Shewanella marisflavi]|uniref:Uncharacterized protein n=1 Tax=Shewanella marisflavi TaxID=260364 RepID=A0AAC9U0Q4_9GAMM|nr:hypothetical protein CFF01_13675 [Shewanella marisflavi]